MVKLPSDPSLPDGVFVEDPALVLDELAVITSPAPPSRRREWPAIEAALHPFRRLVRMPTEAYLEGGDVLRVGRTLFVGQGGRTREAGIRALKEIVSPLGYAVIPVTLNGCLHLKSAAASGWRDAAGEPGVVGGRRSFRTPARGCAGRSRGEPTYFRFRAQLGRRRLPRTADMLRGLGHPVITLDVSELHKAEAGLTCMSLVFRREAKPQD